MLKADVKPKIVTLNPAQSIFFTALEMGKKYCFLKMGRGAGKSTMLAMAIIKCVQQMPRSTGVLVGETYQQILSRTFQSTKEGLEMLGWIEGIHYVVGRNGYKLGFRKPFQAPEDWRRTIHFRNGTVLIMVSLDMPNAGRGLNSFWVIGDEAALLDPVRLFDNVQTTNRSIKTEFKDAPLLNAEIFASSVPMTKLGKWFNNAEAESLKPQNIPTHAYLKANAFVNKNNLTPQWFGRMKEKAVSEIHYNAEILNIDPPGVVNGFYNFFDASVHTYTESFNNNYLAELGFDYSLSEHDNCRQDGDLVSGQPLTICIDPGSKANFMTVWQYLASINEERCLKEFFVKSPEDYENLLIDFDAYYAPHKATNNTVYLRHDAQAYKDKDENAIALSIKIEKKLRELGWRVINVTPKSNNPSHKAKYVVINAIFKETDPRFPKVRINRDNCPNTVISIESAETEVKSNSDYRKDKSSERDPYTLPEHATHLSDTVDYHLYWKYADLVLSEGGSSFFISLN